MRGTLILIIYGGLIAGILAILIRAVPARHNPFEPIDLTQPPGIAAQMQLARFRDDREACFAALDEAGIEYTPIEDSDPGARCPLTDALTLGRSLTPYSAPLRMTCSQTAAVHLWERHIVRPAAEELLGASLSRIETFGSFSCRNIAGTGRLSQHAFGNAIDISGFRLEDGQVVTVLAHWDEDSPKGKFLSRVHKGACGLFSVTLGPEYNAAHADHFHLDMGRGRICR